MLKRRFFVILLMISILNSVLYASADTHSQCKDLYTNFFTTSYTRKHQLFSSCLLSDNSAGECKPISYCTYEKIGIVRLNVCCLNGNEIYVCCPKVTETSISETVYKAEVEIFSRNEKDTKTAYSVLVRQTANQSNMPKQTDSAYHRTDQNNFGNYTSGQIDAGKYSPKQRGILRHRPEQLSGVNHRPNERNIEKYKPGLTSNGKHISDQTDFGKREPERIDFGKPEVEQVHIEEHMLVQIDDGKQRQEQTAIVRHRVKQFSGENHRPKQTNSKNNEPIITDDVKYKPDQADFGKPIGFPNLYTFKQTGAEEHRLRQTEDGNHKQKQTNFGKSDFPQVPFGKFIVQQTDTNKHKYEAIFDGKHEVFQTDNVDHRPENADVSERLTEQTGSEKNKFQQNKAKIFEVSVDDTGSEEIDNGKYRPESAFGIPLIENLDFLSSEFEAAEATVVKSSSKTEPDVKVLHDEYLNPPIVETFLTKDIAYRSECGIRRFEETHKRSIFKGFVLGGSNAQKRDWPWIVSVQVQNRWGLNRFLCGGSLITRRHVLTAAHCFDSINRKSSRIFVILGTNRRNPQPSENATMTDIIKITIHEDYDKSRHYNDIAVMTIAREVQSEKIVPVCLPEEKRITVNSYQQVTVLGWGQLELGGATSETLQQAVLQIIPERNCRRAYLNVSKESLPIGVVSSMICAGAPTGGVDACEGDSGGPLQMELEGRWIQVGIVSFGYKCGLENYPGVYTRVSSFVSWIKQTISVDNQQ